MVHSVAEGSTNCSSGVVFTSSPYPKGYIHFFIRLGENYRGMHMLTAKMEGLFYSCVVTSVSYFVSLL